MEIGIIGIIISKMLPHALAFFLSDLIRLKQESDFKTRMNLRLSLTYTR